MLKKILSRKSKGFTLMELVIVLVIIGILATISVPFYTDYVRRAYVAEATSLCDTIAQAENTYYNINGSFVSVAAGSASATIGLISVDASRNPNFKTFGIAITATSFTITTAATAAGKTITVTYVGYTNASTTINVAYT